MQFKELNIIDPILKGLSKEGYTQPTPIQEQAIPAVLNGRDVLGCAQTGTGKTAAFAVPTLQLLSQAGKVRERKIRSLILTPTRELAIQILESFTTYGKFLDLKACVIFGGVSQKQQVQTLKAGVDILVATPGRLMDLINQKIIHLNDVEIFILDEADRMLDMGFIHDVKKIIAKVPKKKQTLLFSATMPKEITEIVNNLLHNPIKVTITPVSSTAEMIDQSVYFVDKKNKAKLLVEILKDERMNSVLVFTRTKHGADRVVRELNKNHIHAQAIHGNKSQNARQFALKNFKANETRVLVATDIAARGIDIDELPYVINYDLPEVPETYVHRIGRTGRAGSSGTAIAFSTFEEKPLLRAIEKLIKKKIEEEKHHPYPMLIMEVEPKKVVQRTKTKRTQSNKFSAGKKEQNGMNKHAQKAQGSRKMNANVRKGSR